ncbi:MAG TPA: glycosyltransferase [Candidatus Saccharimonadales bacterium]|nr:glycosyltransferase [Candidatus Saccharimonadales bacterium]
MRVALVHDFLNTWGGGEYVLKVFTEMFPEAPVFTITADQKIVDEFFPGVDVRTSFLQNWPGMPKKFKYYLLWMPKAIESFDFEPPRRELRGITAEDLRGFDLILSDSSAYAKGVITKPPTKHICYLHTPTRYMWSDYESYIASAPIPTPLIGQPVVKAIIKHLRKWDLEAAKRPDVIIANSEYIAERTRKYYHRNPDYVLWPPVNGKRFSISPKISDYFLIVGRQEPYKRTDLAIQAANQLGFKLKIVGGGTKMDALKKIAGPTVEFTGRVSDEELNGLYSNCLAFIFPPKEDAGITPLEAMASGRPVIAYAEGGALESVVAGETGEFFQEQTVESLAAAIKNFDASKYDSQKIRAHAMKFDKEVFKQKIRQIIDKTQQS